jgi:hypothetical protein
MYQCYIIANTTAIATATSTTTTAATATACIACCSTAPHADAFAAIASYCRTASTGK